MGTQDTQPLSAQLRGRGGIRLDLNSLTQGTRYHDVSTRNSVQRAHRQTKDIFCTTSSMPPHVLFLLAPPMNNRLVPNFLTPSRAVSSDNKYQLDTYPYYSLTLRVSTATNRLPSWSPAAKSVNQTGLNCTRQRQMLGNVI